MTLTQSPVTLLFHGAALARYGFGDDHPFGADRHDAFLAEATRRGLRARCVERAPGLADEALLSRYHHPGHVALVRRLCAAGRGWLDCGNTPAEPHLYDAARTVVGTTVEAARALARGEATRAFSPIGGLHHARRDRVEGFCVFNDIGVAIETLREEFGLRRIAYVDIDAHHGDGIYYDYEEDAGLCVVDFHEDGRYLYPGTGAAGEQGRGAGAGHKLNLPLAPGAGDAEVTRLWPRAEALLDAHAPELFILQAGADGLAGDPLTHLRLTSATHARVTTAVCRLAERHCGGRVLALGGGGYALANLADAWCTVLASLLEPAPAAH